MSQDIFREVEEALREDKLKIIWQKWRYFIIFGAIAIVISVGVVDFYKGYQKNKLQMRADAWQEILELTNDTQIKMAEDFARIKSDSYADFAWLFVARAKTLRNDDEGAILAFNKVITRADPVYSAIARIEKAIIFLDAENYQESALTLESLLTNEMPFRPLAFYYAGLTALAQKEYSTAKALAETVVGNSQYPQDLRALAGQIKNRAEMLLLK